MQTHGPYILMPFECGGCVDGSRTRRRGPQMTGLARLINGASPGVKLWAALESLTQHGVSFRAGRSDLHFFMHAQDAVGCIYEAIDVD